MVEGGGGVDLGVDAGEVFEPGEIVQGLSGESEAVGEAAVDGVWGVAAGGEAVQKLLEAGVLSVPDGVQPVRAGAVDTIFAGEVATECFKAAMEPIEGVRGERPVVVFHQIQVSDAGFGFDQLLVGRLVDGGVGLVVEWPAEGGAVDE